MGGEEKVENDPSGLDVDQIFHHLIRGLQRLDIGAITVFFRNQVGHLRGQIRIGLFHHFGAVAGAFSDLCPGRLILADIGAYPLGDLT